MFPEDKIQYAVTATTAPWVRTQAINKNSPTTVTTAKGDVLEAGSSYTETGVVYGLRGIKLN